MPIVLFTDFGADALYIGQVRAVLEQHAPRITVIEALNDACSYDIESSAHLLAAVAQHYPKRSVVLAVVDPGVGGNRGAIVLDVDGRTFVGPDNGLLSVVWQRSRRGRCRRIVWRPRNLSNSFHGRDQFAPIAAILAARRPIARRLESLSAPQVLLNPADLPRLIYIDRFGNAITGMRASSADPAATLTVRRHAVRHARVFQEGQPLKAFWYANSLGLIEIASTKASAADRLRLRIGDPVAWSRRK